MLGRKGWEEEEGWLKEMTKEEEGAREKDCEEKERITRYEGV